MSDQHIKASEEGLRHFSRHTQDCNNVAKDCNYKDRSVGAFAPPATYPTTGFERHHILPVSSVGKFETFDAYTAVQREKIRGVYRKTKWCTSREDNVIVLPLKTTYKSNPGARGLDLPCHTVDHNCARGYTDEVTVAVEARVWRKFKKAVDGKGHPQPDEVAAALKSLEADYRKKLMDRGKRKGGTRGALNAFETNDREQIKKETWWLPFSMAKDNVAAQRTLFSLGDTPEWLKNKFASRYPRQR